MRILHVVPSFGVGGMEKIICAIINHTAAHYSHEILSLDENCAALQWLVEPHRPFAVYPKPSGRWQFFRGLYQQLVYQPPDMLMTYNWGATDAIWLGRLAGIARIVHNEHGFNIDESHATSWKRNMIRFMVYRLATKVVVVSQALQTLLQKNYALSERQLLFIPNGIDTSYYTPDAVERVKIRERLGFTAADFVVGFSGRLDPVKNFDFMLNAFALCVQHDRHYKLLIIGDGPEKDKILQLCAHHGLTQHVVLTGQTQEVLPYMRCLDAFILTSFREQMPMTVLEAMAVEVPVVTSLVGELPHIVEHAHDGFLHTLSEGPEAFALSLLRFRNMAILQRMRKAARQKIVSRFQESTMIQHYRHLFSALCDRAS
jgi:L-malate glycosyltransferase